MKLTIAGCNIQFQLNGTSVYVIFDGNEEQAMGAFLTLWNANAYSVEEPCDMGGFSYVTTTLERLQRGLVNLSMLRLLNGDTAQYKGKQGGILATAKAMASDMFEQAEKVRKVTVNAIFCDGNLLCNQEQLSASGPWDGDDLPCNQEHPAVTGLWDGNDN